MVNDMVNGSYSDGKRKKFGTRYLVDKKAVFDHNAWYVDQTSPDVHWSRGLTPVCAPMQRDDVEWNDEQLEEAKRKVQVQAESQLPESIRGIQHHRKKCAPCDPVLMKHTFCAEELEANAGHNWTKFYSVHENKFFKNRNWLFTDFPELSGSTGEV